MEVGDIAEATLMAIATAPDKRVALELLHTLCREHVISDSDISGGKTWDAFALGDDVLSHFFRENSPNVAVEVHLKYGTADCSNFTVCEKVNAAPGADRRRELRQKLVDGFRTLPHSALRRFAALQFVCRIGASEHGGGGVDLPALPSPEMFAQTEDLLLSMLAKETDAAVQQQLYKQLAELTRAPVVESKSDDAISTEQIEALRSHVLDTRATRLAHLHRDPTSGTAGSSSTSSEAPFNAMPSLETGVVNSLQGVHRQLYEACPPLLVDAASKWMAKYAEADSFPDEKRTYPDLPDLAPYLLDAHGLRQFLQLQQSHLDLHALAAAIAGRRMRGAVSSSAAALRDGLDDRVKLLGGMLHHVPVDSASIAFKFIPVGTFALYELLQSYPDLDQGALLEQLRADLRALVLVDPSTKLLVVSSFVTAYENIRRRIDDLDIRIALSECVDALDALLPERSSSFHSQLCSSVETLDMSSGATAGRAVNVFAQIRVLRQTNLSYGNGRYSAHKSEAEVLQWLRTGFVSMVRRIGDLQSSVIATLGVEFTATQVVPPPIATQIHAVNSRATSAALGTPRPLHGRELQEANLLRRNGWDFPLPNTKDPDANFSNPFFDRLVTRDDAIPKRSQFRLARTEFSFTKILGCTYLVKLSCVDDQVGESLVVCVASDARKACELDECPGYHFSAKNTGPWGDLPHAPPAFLEFCRTTAPIPDAAGIAALQESERGVSAKWCPRGACIPHRFDRSGKAKPKCVFEMDRAVPTYNYCPLIFHSKAQLDTLISGATLSPIKKGGTGGKGGKGGKSDKGSREGGRGDAAVGVNSVSSPQVSGGAVVNSVSTPQISDAALALLTAGGGSLDGYILQAGDMRTARDDLHRRLPGDEYVNDRGNILLAISKRQ
jgi:hypothetical protein